MGIEAFDSFANSCQLARLSSLVRLLQRFANQPPLYLLEWVSISADEASTHESTAIRIELLIARRNAQRTSLQENLDCFCSHDASRQVASQAGRWPYVSVVIHVGHVQVSPMGCFGH